MFSVVVLLVKYKFFPFIEVFARLRICLFPYLLCLNLAMVSVRHRYLLLQILRLQCVSVSYRGCSNWVKFVNFPKQKIMSSTSALFSNRARCFSQSECALFGNFIVIYTREEVVLVDVWGTQLAIYAREEVFLVAAHAVRGMQFICY